MKNFTLFRSKISDLLVKRNLLLLLIGSTFLLASYILPMGIVAEKEPNNLDGLMAFFEGHIIAVHRDQILLQQLTSNNVKDNHLILH